MSGTSADRAANTIWPPGLPADTVHLVHQMSTSSTAARAALATLTKAKAYVTFCAVTTDCFVAFKLGTAAASVTTTTGYLIPAGQERSWWIDPAVFNDIEAITASAAGTLKWYVSSPLYEGTV